jgi:hypothetical protein
MAMDEGLGGVVSVGAELVTHCRGQCFPHGFGGQLVNLDDDRSADPRTDQPTRQSSDIDPAEQRIRRTGDRTLVRPLTERLVVLVVERVDVIEIIAVHRRPPPWPAGAASTAAVTAGPTHRRGR